MKRKQIFIGLSLLGVAVIWLCIELLLNGEYHRGRKEVLDVVRDEQRVCSEINSEIQSLRLARDCTVYKDIIDKAIG